MRAIEGWWPPHILTYWTFFSLAYVLVCIVYVRYKHAYLFTCMLAKRSWLASQLNWLVRLVGWLDSPHSSYRTHSFPDCLRRKKFLEEKYLVRTYMYACMQHYDKLVFLRCQGNNFCKLGFWKSSCPPTHTHTHARQKWSNCRRRRDKQAESFSHFWFYPILNSNRHLKNTPFPFCPNCMGAFIAQLEFFLGCFSFLST